MHSISPQVKALSPKGMLVTLEAITQNGSGVTLISFGFGITQQITVQYFIHYLKHLLNKRFLGHGFYIIFDPPIKLF